MMRLRQSLAALLTAVVVQSAVAWVVTASTLRELLIDRDESWWWPLLTAADLAVAAIVLILPPFWLLAARGRLNLWTALIVGVVEGLAGLVALMAISGSGVPLLAVPRVAAVTIAGALAAWAVWRALDRKPA